MNQIYGNLYANGHGTIYPDLLYVDAQSVITQSTTLPGFGFQNLSTLPRNQQTQQFINNISPYLIKSFGPWADTELRYTFSSSNYGGNTVVTTTPSTPGLNSLASTTLNEGTFIAVTGENFQNVVARFTADAAELNGSSVNQSTQVSAYNDLQYNFTPTIAALGRAGYQNHALPGFAGGDVCRGHLARRRPRRDRGAGSAGLCRAAIRQTARRVWVYRVVPGQHHAQHGLFREPGSGDRLPRAIVCI